MRAALSLRSRLMIAAILWTAGLFVGAVVLSTVLLLSFSSWPRVLHGAAWSHAGGFTATALIFMVVGFVLVRRSLTSLDRLRARLASVHAGDETRVAGSYPAEVQPLVDDLNALLDHRAQMVRRALAKAGDLAHGLKTPLAVMSHEVERAASNGHHEFAETMGQQIERMRRQVEYHLAHARAAASGATPGARCSVLKSAEGLVRALQRLHAARGLALAVHVPPAHTVRAQQEDLDEMLGNVLDNACKWARTRVAVESHATDGRMAILVDDDGPGLAPQLREKVLQRGVRADEAAPGSGFGLAIVRELAEVYGGSIVLEPSPLGGVRARLDLPA